MIVTLAHDEEFRLRVAAAVRETPWASAATRVPTVGECEELLATSPPGAIVVGPGIGLPGAVTIARAASRVRTPPPVFLVAPPTTDVLRRAMRAGIRDVLPPDFEAADLIAAFEDAGVRGSGPPSRPGVTAAVFSAKGGVGTSVVASNLAVQLAARAEMPTTLVDLDLASADQAIMHGLSPRWTIQDVADGGVGLDNESIRQVLVEIPGTRARLFPGPVDPALAEMVSAADVAAVIAAVRAESPIAVLDTAASFDDRTLAAIDAADVVVVVASLDVSALRALTVSLQTLDRLGVAPQDIVVTVVRADSKSGLTISDVERTIGRGVDIGIPSTRAVPRSVNEGTPLAVSSRRSSVVKAIDDLAEMVLQHADDGFAGGSAGASGGAGGILSGLLPWSRSSDEAEGSDGAAAAASDDDGGRAVEEASPDEQARSEVPQNAEIVALPRQQPADGDKSETEDVTERPKPPQREVSRLESLPPPVVADDDDGEHPRRRRRR